MAEEKNKKERNWRYRLQLISERHHRVVFTFSMPVWLTAIVAVLLAMATSFFALFIVTSTPLRAYLPGYLDVNKRAVVVESAMRIDSIAHESQLRAKYLENLMEILSDKKNRVENIESYDSAVVHFNDTIISASEREQAFVAKYEEQERFGLNAVTSQNQLSAVSFVNVTKGKAVIPDAQKDDGALSGARVQVSKEMPVLSPLEATVIQQRFIIGQGYELTLQCSNEYVVILSHLSSVMGEEGRNLKAGKVLGHVGAQKESSEKYIDIKIWHKGKPIDPLSVMNF